MVRSRKIALIGAATSAIAVIVTVLSAGLVRADLAAAYSYPNAQGVGLEDAASMTMTYLFVIAGVALLVGVLFASVRSVATTRTGWWVGATLVVLGLAAATYNSTQVFPLAIKLAFFLPVAAGVLWLAQPESGKAAALG
ncbi:hypothetical protein EK0264_04415 [Epidermidibacterium keratini]|uniref:Uncharacterized protein n=1 Tax=Epidermidibacterium keratini TaxID=1891644 RepID=A0A7L4YKL1_9ACTN|nr:hypothetical protein [Epidermidibacterium keratini]QHB99601.1 hypothetical protein EK0264_04415 [Epidermidibacterium keratini]